MSDNRPRRFLAMVTLFLFLTSLLTLLHAGPALPAQTWTPVKTGGIGSPTETSGWTSAIYNGNLVVSTNYGSPPTANSIVYSYDGSSWTPMSTLGFGVGAGRVMSMVVFNGQLYVGTELPVAPYGSIWRYDGSGTSWTKVTDGTSLGYPGLAEWCSMAQGGGWLFAGARLAGSTGSYVYAFNGSTWVRIMSGTISPNELTYLGHQVSLYVVGNYIYLGCRAATSVTNEWPIVVRRSIASIKTDTFEQTEVPWEDMQWGGGGGDIGSMTAGPFGQLVVSNQDAAGAKIMAMNGPGIWTQLYQLPSDYYRATTLFWDGGDSYLFTSNKDVGGVGCEVWKMSTTGANPQMIAQPGFGNANNNSVSSAVSTYGYPGITGAGPGAGLNLNYYLITTNWAGGMEVWGTYLDRPWPTFYFAEGYTGPGFDEWITILNPDVTATANVILEYMLNGEANPAPQTVNIPPASRYTVKVNDIIGANHEVSTKVMCTNGVEIVAERPMYFDYSPEIQGGHVVVGARYTSNIWYFAEGYTGDGSFEYITLQNPGLTDASVKIEYTGRDGRIGEVNLAVPASSRRTVTVSDTAPKQDVSAKVTSTNSVPIVAERPLYFFRTDDKSINGGHCAVGTPAPVKEAYFGEGYTGTGFNEYLLLQNPNNKEIKVNMNLLVKGTGAIPRYAMLPANSRSTYLVNDLVPAGSEVGLALNSDNGFIAERAEYFAYIMGDTRVTGGHDVVGSHFGKRFMFAEGYTGETWDEYLTLANPNTSDITVQVQYMLEGKANPAPVDVTVPASSRFTVRVKDTVPENTNVSCTLTSAGNFIAERPMYFVYENRINGGDCVMGYIPPQ